MPRSIRPRRPLGFHRQVTVVVVAAVLTGWAGVAAQPREVYTAAAIGTGGVSTAPTATRLTINIDRWTSTEDSRRLVQALKDGGPEKMLSTLNDLPDVGTISTPGAIGYPMRYAARQKQPDGGYHITLATDRPLSFAEVWIQPQTVKYPFTFIDLRVNADGRGTGSMIPAARVIPAGDVIVLEDYSSAPIALTDLKKQN